MVRMTIFMWYIGATSLKFTFLFPSSNQAGNEASPGIRANLGS